MRIIKIDLSQDFSEAINEAVKVLSYGGTIVYPTDTVYGFGANALEEISIRKIFNIKQRSFAKPLPMMVRNIKWARELANINEKNDRILSKIWPGPITAVLPKKDLVPSVLTAGQDTVGMRVADSVFVDELLKNFGYPLVSTSANLSGHESTRYPEDIIDTFENTTLKPNLIIDAGVLPESEPSTVLDLTGPHPRILRVGPSRPEDLMKLLEI